MRIHTLSYMLIANDLEDQPVLQKLEQSMLHRMMISEIVLHVGDGIIVGLAPRHGLTSPEWRARRR